MSIEEKRTKVDNMFCFHKWGDVIERRQRCEKCGIVRNVNCNHVWKEVEKMEIISWGKLAGQQIIQKCEICGEFKATELRISQPRIK
jgi:hypothetical protein